MELRPATRGLKTREAPCSYTEGRNKSGRKGGGQELKQAKGTNAAKIEAKTNVRVTMDESSVNSAGACPVDVFVVEVSGAPDANESTVISPP